MGFGEARHKSGRDDLSISLSKASGIGFPIIDRYYKNRVVRYDSDVLSRIITVLDCNIQDIFETYYEEEETHS